jgi:hypothetical protein
LHTAVHSIRRHVHITSGDSAQLTATLAGAGLVLDDAVLDRLDAIVAPGRTYDPRGLAVMSLREPEARFAALHLREARREVIRRMGRQAWRLPVASATITSDPAASRALYVDALRLPLGHADGDGCMSGETVRSPSSPGR